MTTLESLPVAVIGAGPVGLAAAAHLLERGLEPLVLEAGPAVGSAIRQWGHVRVFSTWKYNLDAASVRLLERNGWEAPRPTALPYGSEIVSGYLEPLAATPELRDRIRTGARVVAVTRQGMDKGRSQGRDQVPFVVRIEHDGGLVTEVPARAVIDASGTWLSPAPLGSSGLAVPGEAEARAAGLVTGPLPDVAAGGFAGRRTLVVGSGHSAANMVLDLARVARANPGTDVFWAIRAATPARAYGGGDADQLPARGQLGTRLRAAVESGAVQLLTGFHTASIDAQGDAVTVHSADGRTVEVDRVIPATGFRPDLSILSELRLDLDPAVEAPKALGPLIDPDFHSCGTVPAHGAKVLAQPEKDLYLAGMKSYGRAPTFLMATGYEQVRSIAAVLSGDAEAADAVELQLPETGVCSTSVPAAAEEEACCGTTAAVPLDLGFPTGLRHGRTGGTVTL
ncbi:Pyridine nucleotide-disulphide oxidoreductase [Pseudarthrobacter enclensis]|uniref:Flavoprotein n=1 Tax=Pseudarthrobacter enclensis TaxID=993070 RepID=A0A0V8IMT2_9MICC|nr:FAD-dependent oxidoreductase [Pseudarthrobacter enclensis]KSU76050.1 flavoprotein [Pseudarthrobacter enclensis]SCC10775.1 Pyridine nucleotide-disulphide oxidoreductase [Pseudarthrobacter enclensis]